MNKKTPLLLGIALTVLAACTGSWSTEYDAPLDPAVSRGWTVASVQVSVPDTLTVSDENRLAPNADIVWHGDPPGDRRAQVAEIMRTGIAQGAAGLDGPRAVTIGVTLSEFHSVTPIALARAPSAVHNIQYSAQVFDAASLEPLTPPTPISADLEAYVGAAAIVAAQQGQTPKTRIVNHLAAVTAGWLGIGPDPRRSFAGLGR